LQLKPLLFSQFQSFSSFFIFAMLQVSSYAQSKMMKKTEIEKKVEALIAKMTLQEKLGQMAQFNGGYGNIPDNLRNAIKEGRVGSVLNEVNTDVVNQLQRIAVEESPNGIPLIIGRDVIHGFKTIFPIPLGQAASWNEEIVRRGARIAAIEASSSGVDWTFAPMVDVSRDPRWGRIAESFGEDQVLSSVLGAAMVKGFQGDDLSDPTSIAACVKHFAGYGAAEGGRDYAATSITEGEMRNTYLPPFKACIDAGAATIMTAFNDIDGIPASGNKFLVKQVLRDEWKFNGFVVSDWASITQMVSHGYSPNDKHAAKKAINVGVDMEMATTSYATYAKELIEEKKVAMETIDNAVRNILTVKYRLGLFDNPYTDPTKFPEMANDEHLSSAKKAAVQSIVMLQNKKNILPLSKGIKSVAVIGPLADQPYEQMGTWVFDGDEKYSQTPLSAIKKMIGETKVNFASGLEYSRDRTTKGFAAAKLAADKSDAIILCVGEEAILSGEAHCRAHLDLPGVQNALIDELTKMGKPIIMVVLAGRPLVIGNLLDKVDAVLYAWHPGTMGGPAIADIIFGVEVPSGKLPVTFPKAVGQIPFYHSMKNTGRPANIHSWQHIDKIPIKAGQTSLGNESHHLDVGFTPLFPFGFGLSYTQFKYEDIKLSKKSLAVGESIEVSAKITNTGKYDADEIVQLYIRDLFGSYTRPIKELKDFKRLHIKAGESTIVKFKLHSDHLAFFTPDKKFVTEPGKFHVWIGGASTTNLMAEFEVK
jgi:beta-glucosidase